MKLITFQIFSYFLVASEELKTGICKILTRKPSNSSFFSSWCTDLKNIILEKNHWATSKVVEVKRSFSRLLRPNFGFHLVLTIFVVFGLDEIWTSEGDQDFFSKIIFLKSVHSKEKDETCLTFLVKIFTKSLHRGGVIIVQCPLCMFASKET